MTTYLFHCYLYFRQWKTMLSIACAGTGKKKRKCRRNLIALNYLYYVILDVLAYLNT